MVKASESRKNEIQKNVFYHLTNIFDEDIGNNCLAILTDVDNDEIAPDGVKLLEELDIFKKKTENKEK